MSRKGSNGLATLAVFGAGVGAFLWWDASRGKRGAGGEPSEITVQAANTARTLLGLPASTPAQKVTSTPAVRTVNHGIVGTPLPVLSFDGVQLPPAVLATVNEVEAESRWLSRPDEYIAPWNPQQTFEQAVERARETGSTNGAAFEGATQDQMLAVFRASLGYDQ